MQTLTYPEVTILFAAVFGLLLILLNEMTGLAAQYVVALASVFLVGRVLHYLTIVVQLPFVLRPLSMMLTLGVIATAAILLLV